MSDVQSVFVPSASSLCGSLDGEMDPVYLIETTSMSFSFYQTNISCAIITYIIIYCSDWIQWSLWP